MLTDEQVAAIRQTCYDAMGWGPDLPKFARAIEAAAAAPLLERIAALEAKLAAKTLSASEGSINV